MIVSETNVIDSFTDEFHFLSNFYHVDVALEGRVYPTLEHAYQAAKVRDPLDPSRAMIARAKTPGEAKKLGRTVSLRRNWNVHWKHLIMRLLIEAKFEGELADGLLATGDALLIEGNTWHDNSWGDCRCGHPLCARQGDNLLGVALMRRRVELRVEL